MASGGSRMMAQSKPTVGELFEKLQSEKMADEATVQLRKLARSDTAAVGFDPGEVIPDGSGGMLAYFALGGQSGPPTIANIGPNGIVQQTINQLANFNPGDVMVLGDNNTAFVTDGYTVVAFNPSTLQTAWTYTSTGGTLSFVAATSGGGVTINDSQQGVIQLDSNGNGGTPAASLQGAASFGITQWDEIASGVLAMVLGPTVDIAATSFPEPAGSGADNRTNLPTLAEYFPADPAAYGVAAYSPITTTLLKDAAPNGRAPTTCFELGRRPRSPSSMRI